MPLQPGQVTTSLATSQATTTWPPPPPPPPPGHQPGQATCTVSQRQLQLTLPTSHRSATQADTANLALACCYLRVITCRVRARHSWYAEVTSCPPSCMNSHPLHRSTGCAPLPATPAAGAQGCMLAWVPLSPDCCAALAPLQGGRRLWAPASGLRQCVRRQPRLHR